MNLLHLTLVPLLLSATHLVIASDQVNAQTANRYAARPTLNQYGMPVYQGYPVQRGYSSSQQRAVQPVHNYHYQVKPAPHVYSNHHRTYQVQPGTAPSIVVPQYQPQTQIQPSIQAQAAPQPRQIYQNGQMQLTHRVPRYQHQQYIQSSTYGNRIAIPQANKVIQPLQPTYTQPVQPTYTQPVRPAYNQSIVVPNNKSIVVPKIQHTAQPARQSYDQQHRTHLHSQHQILRSSGQIQALPVPTLPRVQAKTIQARPLSPMPYDQHDYKRNHNRLQPASLTQRKIGNQAIALERPKQQYKIKGGPISQNGTALLLQQIRAPQVPENKIVNQQKLRHQNTVARIQAVEGLATQEPIQLTALQKPKPAAKNAWGVPIKYQRRIVDYKTKHKPGTVIVDTSNRFLYLVRPNGKAIRFGIGVARDGFEWSGTHRVTRKAEWPDWRPPAEMRKRQPELPKFMKGGPKNPMGARAIYIGNTLYRIHGTNEPWTIGQPVSSGCIRMVNKDVIDLYKMVKTGAKVVVS